MNIKTLLFTLVFFIGFTFQNCSSDCECCFPEAPDFFDINDMEVIHLDSDKSLIERLKARQYLLKIMDS